MFGLAGLGQFVAFQLLAQPLAGKSNAGRLPAKRVAQILPEAAWRAVADPGHLSFPRMRLSGLVCFSAFGNDSATESCQRRAEKDCNVFSFGGN